MSAQRTRCPSCRQPLYPHVAGIQCANCGQILGPVRSRRALLQDTGRAAALLAVGPALLASCTPTVMPANVVGVHDWNQADFTKKANDLGSQGWRPITLSMYGDPADPRFAAVFVKGGPAWLGIYNYQFADAQTVFNQQVAKGFYPTIISANGAGDAARVALIFEEQQGPVPLTRWGMPWGDYSQHPNLIPTTFTDFDAHARVQNLWLISVTVYGDPTSRLYGAIWAPNPAGALWCCDSSGDSVDALNARVSAQDEQLARPAYITLSADHQYVSVFRNDQLPAPALIKTSMTHDEYQTQFNEQVALGLTPVCLQGGGAGAQTQFAAIFVKSATPQPRTWTATGFPASTEVDGVVQQVMERFHVRAASLAVVQDTRLVLARAYTLAEPGYPITQPTTYFRLASCSKTMTALAVEQLVTAGRLGLDQPIQDILQLTTPQGAAPGPDFSAITVRELLEMSSGLAAGVDTVQIAQAFGSPLPITATQLASFLAGYAVAPPPVYGYNNNGYNLLGSVVAKVRHPEIADLSQGFLRSIQDSILSPLSIKRCRISRTRRQDQPPGEALYDSSWAYFGLSMRDLYVAPSEVDADQHLVPMPYGAGAFNLEATVGAGGLSMAMPDLARMLAGLNVQENNPVLDPQDIGGYFSQSMTKNQVAPGQHGCYGWDAVSAQAGGYAANKGGLFAGTSSTIYFQTGGLCFAVAWNYDQINIPDGDSTYVYPDWPDLRAAAVGNNVSSRDLFPQFGMASLGS
jgi:CubicO group peptidase (beta-lactamase class C family)